MSGGSNRTELPPAQATPPTLAGCATGSNTIFSLGGGNLFNHPTLQYTDGNGAFHALVVGGDDVNTPGTKQSGVFFY